MSIVANGKTALDMLKVALGIVFLGGGAAFTAGKISTGDLHVAMDLHERVTHGELTRQMDALKKAVDRSAYDALAARMMTEALLSKEGVPIPKLPPPPDAGE